MNIPANNFKVICLDLDGTLLPKTKEISQETIDYLNLLQEKGIYVVVATGRNPKETFEISKVLNSVKYNGYMICCNGQMIHSYQKGEDIESVRVPQNEAKKIATMAKKHPIVISVDNDEALYQTRNMRGILHLIKSFSKQLRNTQWVLRQLKTRHIHQVGNIDPYINKDLRKICFSGSHHALSKFSHEIEQEFPHRFAKMFVASTWLEVMDIHVSKGHALETLSQILQIPMEQFIAFGDGENDITMLEKAGWGVAMENAMPTVKKVANDIAGNNDEDGVRCYLQKLGL